MVGLLQSAPCGANLCSIPDIITKPPPRSSLCLGIGAYGAIFGYCRYESGENWYGAPWLK